MSLTHEDVTRILKIIDSMEGRDVHIEYGDLKIQVSRSGRPLPSAAPPSAPAAAVSAPTAAAPAQAPPTSAPALASAQPATAAEAPIAAGHVAIRAPMVGTFYRAPSPGAAPFVEVGGKVGAQDTVCLLEVMKLFNSIKAGTAGRIVEIRAENGALVQRDAVLLVIDPVG